MPLTCVVLDLEEVVRRGVDALVSFLEEGRSWEVCAEVLSSCSSPSLLFDQVAVHSVAVQQAVAQRQVAACPHCCYSSLLSLVFLGHWHYSFPLSAAEGVLTSAAPSLEAALPLASRAFAVLVS